MSLGLVGRETGKRGIRLHLKVRNPDNATGKKAIYAGSAGRKSNLKELQRQISSGIRLAERRMGALAERLRGMLQARAEAAPEVAEPATVSA